MLRRNKESQIDGKPLLNLGPKDIVLEKLEFTAEERELYTQVESVARPSLLCSVAHADDWSRLFTSGREPRSDSTSSSRRAPSSRTTPTSSVRLPALLVSSPRWTDAPTSLDSDVASTPTAGEPSSAARASQGRADLAKRSHARGRPDRRARGRGRADKGDRACASDRAQGTGVSRSGSRKHPRPAAHCRSHLFVSA